jgi:transposase
VHKFLQPNERIELLQELRVERHRKHADRIRVILLLDEGQTYKNICKFLFIDEGTIANWRKRYKEGGLDRLFDDQYKTKKCSLSPNELELLSTHLTEHVYRRTSEIAKYIKDNFGVEYKNNSVRRLLKSLGFSYKKPKKMPSKASLEKQLHFLRQYNGFKSHGPVYFLDSTHPRHCPVMGYGWIKKGEDKFIPCNTGRAHLNINGAVNIESLDVITRQSETVDKEAICELLKAIRGKNLNEEKIYVVMDNAPYNRSHKVRNLAKELNIRIRYLPPYSPNLNHAERLWRFFREEVLSMQYFETLDDFSKACSQFFRGIRKYREQLETLFADKFQLLGT